MCIRSLCPLPFTSIPFNSLVSNAQNNHKPHNSNSLTKNNRTSSLSRQHRASLSLSLSMETDGLLLPKLPHVRLHPSMRMLAYSNTPLTWRRLSTLSRLFVTTEDLQRKSATLSHFLSNSRLSKATKHFSLLFSKSRPKHSHHPSSSSRNLAQGPHTSKVL